MFSKMFSKEERMLIIAIVITSLILTIILSLLYIKIENYEKALSKIAIGQEKIEKEISEIAGQEKILN